MKVGVFHPGTQHSWQTALALQQLNRLRFYQTSVLYQADRWPYRLENLPGPIGRRLRAEFRRIAAPALDPALVRTHGAWEWIERAAIRARLRRVSRTLDAIGNKRFVRGLAHEVRGPGRFALWGYDNAALSTFELAKQYGRTCILDRTIGDGRVYNATMADLQDHYADWFVGAEKRRSRRSIAIEAQENALADRILVGSEFAARTVRNNAETPAIADKVEVLRYCYDDRLFGSMPPPSHTRSGPVRFLFVGLCIPRKGFHHVLEAISRLPASEATLTIIGHLGVPASVFARYADRVTYRPSVARDEIPAIMAAHDVLLFPSYFEGAGLVLYEALASGLALIQSDRADIAVTHDSGVLIETLTTDVLLAAMRRPIEDRALLAHWRDNAQPLARRYTFVGYRDRIDALLNRMVI